MTHAEATELSESLERQFGGEVDCDEVGSGRFRFAIVSPAFSGMPQMKRQDEVWTLVDKLLDREKRLDVSMILVLAPEETAASQDSR